MTYGIWPDHSPHFCSYNFATNECDYVDYGLRMGFGYFFPGVLIGCLTMIVGVILMCIYCCCRCCVRLDCCGWCYWVNCLNWCHLRHCRLPGKAGDICCSKARLWRVVMGFLAVLTGLFLLIAISIDSDAYAATDSWISDTKDFVQNQLNDVYAAEAEIKSFVFYPVVKAQYDYVTSQAQSYVQTAQDYVGKADDIRSFNLAKFIVEVLFVFLVLVLQIGGLIVPIFSRWRIPYLVYAGFILVCLLPLFFFFSYNVFAERLFADICEDNDLTIAVNNLLSRMASFPARAALPLV